MATTKTVTIDFAKIRTHLNETALQNGGLEDASGRTPDTLDEGIEYLCDLLPDGCEDLRILLGQLGDMVREEHEEGLNYSEVLANGG